MIRRHFGQDYLAAERFADEYAGDNLARAFVVERFDDEDTEVLDTEARGELWVVDDAMACIVGGWNLEVQYETDRTVPS